MNLEAQEAGEPTERAVEPQVSNAAGSAAGLALEEGQEAVGKRAVEERQGVGTAEVVAPDVELVGLGFARGSVEGSDARAVVKSEALALEQTPGSAEGRGV